MSSKQFKYCGPLTSDILGEVHSVLYESYLESYIDSDSECSECEDIQFSIVLHQQCNHSVTSSQRKTPTVQIWREFILYLQVKFLSNHLS
ncbi:hypothetical protein DPMN_160378 [Dreissena polymorpha]|uniref:Uncharacterized protein n=1 Tax=Dreissena polymorpha TaxID=45954 RepID=A0A9D4IRK8_DREPO|nr:hypothetical protein DPMN_160378 [Dreissena polymorpha]